LYGCVDQPFDLVALGDVCCYGNGLATTRLQLIRQRLNAIKAPRTQGNARALRGEKAGGRFAQPAARARDDDDFSFDVIAYDLDSSMPCRLLRDRSFSPSVRDTAPLGS
jgi:hypothetical protein